MNKRIDQLSREDLRECTLNPCTLVIFGASGDITRRKLIPALYSLSQQGLLPKAFSVVGFARTPMSHEEFREKVAGQISSSQEASWKTFSQQIYYFSGDSKEIDAYHQLSQFLLGDERHQQSGKNLLFYLATPPSLYSTIIENLEKSELSGKHRNQKSKGKTVAFTRVIIEKPFGSNLETATSLNNLAGQAFDENQIFRIDHYLAKETVQNILAFRFANGIFEPIWNRQYIDHIQITVAESLGIDTRGAYYEEAGALRDIVQNHLLQLLALVAMEPPVALDADAIRDEKVKVWRAVRKIRPAEADQYTVRGQYGRGTIDHQAVKSYREEKDVNPQSLVETFVAVQFLIDNWRWDDVPFYLRTGKRLPKRATEIAIQFKRAPHLLFRRVQDRSQKPNLLLLQIQPDEGISLQFEAKSPGPGIQLQSETLDFRFGGSMSQKDSAYERLLLDAMRGDQTLFTRRDGIEAAWSLIDPIIEGWKNYPPVDFPSYEGGTWGPQAANELIKRKGAEWRRL